MFLAASTRLRWDADRCVRRIFNEIRSELETVNERDSNDHRRKVMLEKRLEQLAGKRHLRDWLW